MHSLQKQHQNSTGSHQINKLLTTQLTIINRQITTTPSSTSSPFLISLSSFLPSSVPGRNQSTALWQGTLRKRSEAHHLYRPCRKLPALALFLLHLQHRNHLNSQSSFHLRDTSFVTAAAVTAVAAAAAFMDYWIHPSSSCPYHSCRCWFHAWLRPSLPDISIQQITAKKLDVTGNEIACNFDVLISLRNHNDEIQLSYRGGSVRVSYDEGMLSLGSSTLPEMDQPDRNSTVMKVKVVSSGVPVDGFTGKTIATEYKERRLVVDVEVRMKVAAVVKGMNVSPVPVTAACIGVGVGATEDGSSRKCKIFFNGLIVLN